LWTRHWVTAAARSDQHRFPLVGVALLLIASRAKGGTFGKIFGHLAAVLPADAPGDLSGPMHSPQTNYTFKEATAGNRLGYPVLLLPRFRPPR
jgi:hypothetical protein